MYGNKTNGLNGMLDLKGKTIFAIAPHVDDVELGAGGTIYQLCKNNTVYYIGLSLPPLVDSSVLLTEFQESAKVLRIKKENLQKK